MNWMFIPKKTMTDATAIYAAIRPSVYTNPVRSVCRLLSILFEI